MQCKRSFPCAFEDATIDENTIPTDPPCIPPLARGEKRAFVPFDKGDIQGVLLSATIRRYFQESLAP